MPAALVLGKPRPTRKNVGAASTAPVVAACWQPIFSIWSILVAFRQIAREALALLDFDRWDDAERSREPPCS